MTKKPDAPAIRFKGFSDAWEQRKLGEVMNVTSVKRIHQSDWTDYGIRFLRARDIVSAYKNEEPDDYLYISKEKYDEYSSISGKVSIGDMLVTGVGTIGVPYLVENSEPLYFKDGNIIWFQNEDKVFGKFLFYSFAGKSIQDFITESAGIGTVGTYTIESGKKTPISLPNKEEQERIGLFFANLDHLITLHQRKFEKLTNVKKSMLEKMFPQNGCSYPEIRFKGFTDAWEQRKLTEFVEFFSGLTYTPNDVQENGTLVLRSSNVSNGEVVDADNIYVNPQVVNSENVKVGDIVVVVRNGSRSLIGKHAQIKAFMPNTVIGAFMTGIRSECPEFTNALLNTSRFEEEIAMNMGATINQITGYMFSKMEFKVPCLDEQKKIGEYFEKLDNLITLHQRELEKLQNIKKSMLEKMFVYGGTRKWES